MTLRFAFSRKPCRRSHSRPTSCSTSQQFEPRCLLSASTIPAASLDCDYDEVVDSESDFFLDADFAGLYDEVVLVEPIDSSGILESFALTPESIQTAIDDLAFGQFDVAGSGDGLDSSGLQIVSLSVSTDSGLSLPVDIYVWDGEADSVLTSEFLSQIEIALGDALRDVLATGAATSTAGLSDAQASATDFAATYGIQPIEIYVDIAQDTTAETSQLYVSGVTVVSEDPADSEFVFVDEFVFFADDFVTSTGEAIPELAPVEESTVSEPETVDTGLGIDDTNPAATDLPTSAAADSQETTVAELTDEEETGRPETDSTLKPTAFEQRSGDELVDGHSANSDADTTSAHRKRSEHQQANGNASEKSRRQSQTNSASEGSSSQPKTWRQRLRIRAAAAARQIATAAYRDQPGSLPSIAISAADSIVPNWSDTVAAFSETLLDDELFGLIDSDSSEDLSANGNTQPTYAQITSGAGALLIATAAGVHTIRQRRFVDRTRSRIAGGKASLLNRYEG